MPDISDDEEEHQIKILNNEIEKLKSQLNSALKKIEILSLENSELKQINEELVKKNSTYSKITKNPPKHRSLTPKKSTNSNSKLKLKLTEKLKNSSNEDAPTYDTEIPSTSNLTQDIRAETTTEHPLTRQNIFLISSETSSRLYTLVERNKLSNFDICHYRKPTCGLRQLLDKIEEKVQKFTHADYCVIYIGEEDFRKTHNYLQLVMFIREKLLPLNHTNFIICLPTYRYMTDSNIMFNSRVETFNNLLYLDVNTCNYAYLLDSNLNLPYKYHNYNRHYGSLNNSGLKLVLEDLQDMILCLDSRNTTQLEVDCNPQNQIHDDCTIDSQHFFR